MRGMAVFSIALSFLLAPAAAIAAGFDVSKPILCSVTTVIECTPDADRSISPESIGLPQFIMVDAAKKKVWPAADKDPKRVSEIRRTEWLGGRLILQGADEGIDKNREAVGWTATIAESTGKFILTAAGENAAFVVFGACLQQ